MVQKVNIQTEISKIDNEKSVKKKGFLLPYQIKWAFDESRFTACEKSVRIGITFAQEFKVVRDRQIAGQGDYLHSSVTQGVALNFIRECQFWIEQYKIRASSIGEMEYIDEITKLKETALYIEFPGTRQRIVSFSSSPNNMRGFGGAVGLDEIAFHRQMKEMMKGAGSRSLWGDPVSMWSSHHGIDTEWNMFLQKERALGDASKWSIHRITILDAVDQGLVEKINEVKGTKFSREEFLKDCETAVGGRDAYEEECLCDPRPSGRPAISWYDIQSAQDKFPIISMAIQGDAKKGDEVDPSVASIIEDNPFGGLNLNKRYSGGWDIARTGHLSSIWVNETDGKNHRCVLNIKLHKCKFSSQRQFIRVGMNTLKGLTMSGDATGLGMDSCEKLEDEFPGRFTGVNFTAFKPHLGGRLTAAFEDGRQIIPQEPDEIAYDIRGIKTETRGTRVIYSESRNPTNPDSHCDIAWSCALAIANAEDADLGPCKMEAAGSGSESSSNDGYHRPDNSDDFNKNETWRY